MKGSLQTECSIHMKWVHRRCSGVTGSLQTVSAAFICKKCQGETLPSVMAEEGSVVV